MCSAVVDAGPESYGDIAGSSLRSLSVDTQSGTGIDLDGDGDEDNALGEILASFKNLLSFDINGLLEEATRHGTVRLGAGWPSIGGDLGDLRDVTTDILVLLDNDGDASSRETFFVDPSSFIEGTAEPANRITGRVENARWLVSGGDLPVKIPTADRRASVLFRDVRVEGSLSVDETGVGVAEGTIAGAVTLEDFFSVTNAFFRSTTCSCLVLVDDPIAWDRSRGNFICRDDVDNDACNEPENSLCKVLTDACSLAVLTMSSRADIDTDDDGEFDALSFFLRFTMDGTEFLGTPGRFFQRGETSDDGLLDLIDAVVVFAYLFSGGDSPGCMEAADADNSGVVGIDDGIFILRYLFQDGKPTAPPGPPGLACGPDPGRADSPRSLGCDSYDHC